MMRRTYIVTATVVLDLESLDDPKEAQERDESLEAWLDAVVGDELAERMDAGELEDFSVDVKEEEGR